MPVYKWISCHLDYTVWYVDAGQGFAPVKRLVSNACHTVWYVDAGQRTAPVKCPFSNACHSVRYVDAGKRKASPVFASH